MRHNLVIQRCHSSLDESLASTLAEGCRTTLPDEVFVGVAYATVSGVRALLEGLAQYGCSPSFRWVIGLDDCITQPGALDLCVSLPNSTVRVATHASVNARFHPKVFLLRSRAKSRSLMFVGSANLTGRALLRNCEAVSILSPSTAADHKALRNAATEIWETGKPLTPQHMARYRRQYEAMERKRRTIGIPTEASDERRSGQRDILESDSAETDPSLAAICWIEVGKNTAQGRELELKAEQALFFGLTRSAGDSQGRQFRVSDGTVAPLNLKYQSDNGMWRLQMTNDVPEVRTGLRPLVRGRLGRSPFVAVFERLGGRRTFRLRFISDRGAEYRRIRKRSENSGTIGETSARRYGWY